MSSNPLELFLRLTGRIFLDSLGQILTDEELEREARRRVKAGASASKHTRPKALKPRKAFKTPTPRTVLGVASGASVEFCEMVYRARARKEHPDVGGDLEAWTRVTAAMVAIREAK